MLCISDRDVKTRQTLSLRSQKSVRDTVQLESAELLCLRSMAENAFPAPVNGTLHVYDPANRLVYFEQPPSASSSSSRCNSVIFVGGLGDGLAAVPFLQPLAQALHARTWSLIQVLMRSSYSGWGMGSVDQDAEDLHNLETYLRRRDVKSDEARLVLLGHSTGAIHSSQS